MPEYKEAGIFKSIHELEKMETKTIRFDKIWVIEDYPSYHGCFSPIFSVGSSEKIKLRLKLFAHQEVWPALLLLPCDISEITVKHTYSILDATGKKAITLPSYSHPKTVSPTGTTEYTVRSGENRFLRKDVYGKLLPNGRLTLFCDIELLVNKMDLSADFPAIEVPACDLIGDISHLLESHKLSDFTITVDGQELLVHKSVLSVRSRVFSAMFEHDMAEKQKNRMVVTDVEGQVFKEMLKFIYTGEAPNVNRIANKLLAAAEKYELGRLKLMCEEALRAQMVVDNAADTLMMADLHNAEQLKEHAIEFIASNTTDVMATPSFETMVKSYPTLIAKILRALARKQEKA